MMRVMSQINQLAVDPEEFLASLVLSQEVESLKTRYKYVALETTCIEKDSLETHGHVERVSIMSEERRLHRSSTELVGQVEDLKD